MNLEELRAELTKRGIAFAANAGVANLQQKLDAAIAAENAGTPDPGETPPPPADPGKPSGPVEDAEPAAAPFTAPVESELEILIAAKVAAGLDLATATEVAKRQIAWNAEQARANG